MANPNFATLEANTINSLTSPLIAQKISDVITGKIPLLYLLNKMGHKEHENGGLEYRFPIFKEQAVAQAYTGLTPLTSSEKDLVSTAVLYRKLFTIDVTLSGEKLLQNSGNNPTAVINYITAQLEIAAEGMKNTLAGSGYGLFSAQGDTAIGITGLGTMLPTSTTTGTYAGFDRATYSYWRHLADEVATGWNTDGLISLRSLYLQLVRGDEAPSVITMTRSTYTNFERSLTATLSYNLPSPKTQFGDLGFEHINYHGTPCIIDDGQPANTSYLINLKYVKLLVHQDRDMSVRDFITPITSDSIVGRLYWAGNLVCSNLPRQGILHGLPDTWA